MGDAGTLQQLKVEDVLVKGTNLGRSGTLNSGNSAAIPPTLIA